MLIHMQKLRDFSLKRILVAITNIRLSRESFLRQSLTIADLGFRLVSLVRWRNHRRVRWFPTRRWRGGCFPSFFHYVFGGSCLVDGDCSLGFLLQHSGFQDRCALFALGFSRIRRNPRLQLLLLETSLRWSASVYQRGKFCETFLLTSFFRRGSFCGLGLCCGWLACYIVLLVWEPRWGPAPLISMFQLQFHVETDSCLSYKIGFLVLRLMSV